MRVDLDRGRARVRIVVVEGGREQVLRHRRLRGAAPLRMAFVLCENQVTAVVDQGSGWRAVTTERTKVARALDLRDPATLARHSYAWGPVDADATAAVGEVRAGPFGMAGVRDPHLVQHVDGTPYVRDGLLYLTMTCAGMGFFSQAHWGVFTLDLAAPERVTQVAHLFSRRDGLLLGDHAGQVVVDGDRTYLAVSSWGDFHPATGVRLRQLRGRARRAARGARARDGAARRAHPAQRLGPGRHRDRRALARGVRRQPRAAAVRLPPRARARPGGRRLG